MLGLKKPNFKTKIRFEKSHNAENCKRGHFEIFLTSILLQNSKIIEARLEKFCEKKTKNENFQQSHSAEKSERRDPLGFFNIRSVAKYQKKTKAGCKKITKPK